MKRFDFFCSYDGGGPADEQESPGGEFVRFSDAEAAVKQARIDALEDAKQVADDSDHIVDGRGYYDQLGDANATARNIVSAIESLKGTP